jgi:hypothetical protein
MENPLWCGDEFVVANDSPYYRAVLYGCKNHLKLPALFPNACQVLDYYHCAEYLHKVAKAQYGQTCQALEWVEATLTRLYMGKAGTVLGGLRRMQPTSAEALKAVDNCWVYLNDHRGRTAYDKFRRGGYPLGSGGMESSWL